MKIITEEYCANPKCGNYHMVNSPYCHVCAAYEVRLAIAEAERDNLQAQLAEARAHVVALAVIGEFCGQDLKWHCVHCFASHSMATEIQHQKRCPLAAARVWLDGTE